jgi:hypothetical protein
VNSQIGFDMLELDELQLQRIVRKKSGVKPGDIRALHDFLVTLSQAPRFELLQHLQIAQFKAHGKGVGGSLGTLTLGELVDHGALRISGLPSMGGRRLKILNAILGSLITEPSGTDEESSSSLIEEVADLGSIMDSLIGESATFPQDNGVLRRINSHNTPRFITTRTQEEFQAVISSLRGNERLSSLNDQEIGKYWDSSDPGSPFEERLTFGQLLQLDHGAFLRKRSINERKIRALINAVNKALAAHSGLASNLKVAAAGLSKPVDSAPVLPQAWRELENSPRLILWSMAKAVGTLLGSVTHTQYSQKLREVVLKVEPVELVVMVLNSMFSASTAQEVSGLNEVEYRRISVKATHILEQLAVEQFEEPIAALREMLSGIGVYNHMLRRALGNGEQSSLLEELFLSVLLKYIGASPVSIGSVCLGDFLTLDITRIHYFIDLIKSRLPLSENDMDKEMNALLSALRPEDRSKIINTVAGLNKEEGGWIKLSPQSEKTH